MALTAEQKALFDTVEAQVQEIQDTVSNSLSIQNVGGSVIFNQAIDLKPKLAKLRASFA